MCVVAHAALAHTWVSACTHGAIGPCIEAWGVARGCAVLGHVPKTAGQVGAILGVQLKGRACHKPGLQAGYKGCMFCCRFPLHLSLQTAALLPTWCSHSCSWTPCPRFRRITACEHPQQHAKAAIRPCRPPYSEAAWATGPQSCESQLLPSRRLTRGRMCHKSLHHGRPTCLCSNRALTVCCVLCCAVLCRRHAARGCCAPVLCV